jgi:hypothetical protein
MEEVKASASASKASEAKPKKLKKGEEERLKEIRECIIDCQKRYKNIPAEQQIEHLKKIVKDALEKMGAPTPVDKMDFSQCEIEVDAICKITSGFKQLGLLFRFRCGALWNQQTLLATMEVGWTRTWNGVKYTKVDEYLAAKYENNTTDVNACKNFYHAVVFFPPLISADRTWGWIKQAMTKRTLQDMCATFEKHDHSFP